MKNKLLKIFLGTILFILMLGIASAVECGEVPTDDCEVTTDTTFNISTYNLANGINLIGSDVTLDCNGATLNGLGTGSLNGIYIVSPHNNITVKNCNVQNYNKTIYTDGTVGSGSLTDITIFNNNFINASVYCIDLFFTQHIDIYNNNCTVIGDGRGLVVGQETDNVDARDIDSTTGINIWDWNGQFYNITIDTELNNHTAELSSFIDFDVTAFFYDVKIDGYDITSIKNVTDGQSFTKDTYIVHFKPWQYTSSLPNGINIGASGITLDFRGGYDTWAMWGGTSVEIKGTGSNSGIRNNGYDNVIIKNAIITDYSKGIDIDNSENVTVLGNTIYNSDYGIEPDGNIALSIINNTIIGSSNRGISAESGQTDLLIDGNSIHDSFLPIRISGEWGDNLGVTIINNNVTNSTIQLIDIALGTNNNIVVTDNYFTGSTGSANAVLFGNIVNFTYTRNTVESPNFYVFGTNSNFEIYDSEFGSISVEGTATGLLNFTNNSITDNDVINSLSPAQSVGGNMVWTGTDGVTYNVTTPTNDQSLTQNTMFTDGTFNLPDGVTFGDVDNIELHCRGQTLNGSGSGVGIQTWKENLTIRDCLITNYGDGIRGSKWSNQLTIYNNDFSGQTNNGDIFVNAPDDYGGDNMHIFNNTFTSNVLFEGGIFSNNAIIEDNIGTSFQTFGDNNLTLRNNSMGILTLWGTSNVTVENNRITYGGDETVLITEDNSGDDDAHTFNLFDNAIIGEVKIANANDITIENNTITGRITPNNAENLIVRDNNITSTSTYAFNNMVTSGDSIIEDNNIDGNNTGRGFRVSDGDTSSGNLIIRNNVFSNIIDLYYSNRIANTNISKYDNVSIYNNIIDKGLLITGTANVHLYNNTLDDVRFYTMDTDICNNGIGNTYLGKWEFYALGVDYLHWGNTTNFNLDANCPSLTIPNGIIIWNNWGDREQILNVNFNDATITGSGDVGINVTGKNSTSKLVNSTIENLTITGFTKSLVFETNTENNTFQDSTVDSTFEIFGVDGVTLENNNLVDMLITDDGSNPSRNVIVRNNNITAQPYPDNIHFYGVENFIFDNNEIICSAGTTGIFQIRDDADLSAGNWEFKNNNLIDCEGYNGNVFSTNYQYGLMNNISIFNNNFTGNSVAGGDVTISSLKHTNLSFYNNSVRIFDISSHDEFDFCNGGISNIYLDKIQIRSFGDLDFTLNSACNPLILPNGIRVFNDDGGTDHIINIDGNGVEISGTGDVGINVTGESSSTKVIDSTIKDIDITGFTNSYIIEENTESNTIILGNFDGIFTDSGTSTKVVVASNVTMGDNIHIIPTGITINASGIILDCGGSVLNGTGGSGIGISGSISSNVSDVEIKNCNIEGYGTAGYFPCDSGWSGYIMDNWEFHNNNLSNNLDGDIVNCVGSAINMKVHNNTLSTPSISNSADFTIFADNSVEGDVSSGATSSVFNNVFNSDFYISSSDVDICNDGLGNTYNGKIGFRNRDIDYAFESACPLTVPDGILLEITAPQFPWESRTDYSMNLSGNDVVLTGSGDVGINIIGLNSTARVKNSVIQDFDMSGFTKSLEFDANTDNNIFQDSTIEDPYYDYGTSNQFLTLDVPAPVFSGVSPTTGFRSLPQDFTYTITTIAEIDYCNLYFDGNVAESESSFGVNDKTNPFSYEISSIPPTMYEEHNWNILCYDVFGNLVDTGSYQFRLSEVGQHESNDITGLVFDTAVEGGREVVGLAGLIAMIGVGTWLLFLI